MSDARDDAGLVRAFQAGETGAFRLLVERHQQKIYRLCLRVCRDRTSAEDAMQEAFINAYRALARFRSEAQFTTWLYRIAYNAALGQLRRRPPEESVDIEDLMPRFDARGVYERSHSVLGWPPNPGRPDALGDLLESEFAVRLAAELEKMPEKYRTPFQLVHVEGLPNAEAAEVLGLGVEALKSRLHRARLYLRERLSRYYAGESESWQRKGHPKGRK